MPNAGYRQGAALERAVPEGAVPEGPSRAGLGSRTTSRIQSLACREWPVRRSGVLVSRPGVIGSEGAAWWAVSASTGSGWWWLALTAPYKGVRSDPRRPKRQEAAAWEATGLRLAPGGDPKPMILPRPTGHAPQSDSPLLPPPCRGAACTRAEELRTGTYLLALTAPTRSPPNSPRSDVAAVRVPASESDPLKHPGEICGHQAGEGDGT